MALTLAESAVLCQDKLVKGIMEELILESPMMGMMPFVELVGNALAINREDPDNMGEVGFRAVGGVWTESTAKFEQVTFPGWSHEQRAPPQVPHLAPQIGQPVKP